MASSPADLPASPAEAVRYRIDAHDRLTFFSDSWRRSAEEAGAPGLAPELLLGRCLWDCFSTEAVASLYRVLVDAARRGRPLEFPYRCDLPDRERVFNLTITADDTGAVEFCSVLVESRPRPPVALLSPSVARDLTRSVEMCSWCHAVSLPVDFWVPIELAAKMAGYLAAEPLPRLITAVCPSCRNYLAGKSRR